MTNKEAIKDIQENIKPFVGGKSLDMAIEALKNEPRWIPVTERLPEEEGRYLVTDESCGYKDVHESFYFPNGDEYYEPYWDYNNVSAWMPLPYPYREVEE